MGLYNSSDGFGQDTAQVGRDVQENTHRAAGTWDGPSGNPATRSLSDSIVRQLNDPKGGSLHLLAHSQGGLVTANALYDARQRLTAQHGEQRANELLGRVQVETFGGAARNYADGPQYTHWLNRSDRATGGMGPDERTGGRGAIFQRFDNNSGAFSPNHSFTDVYWPQRQRQFQQ